MSSICFSLKTNCNTYTQLLDARELCIIDRVVMYP